MVGLSLDAKTASSGEVRHISILWGLSHQCPYPLPRSESQPIPDSLGDPPEFVGASNLSSCGVAAFCCIPVYVNSCVHAPRVESFCFPQSCGTPQESPAVLQGQILQRFLLLMPDPQAREPDVDLRTLTLMGKPLQCNYFSVVHHPPNVI